MSGLQILRDSQIFEWWCQYKRSYLAAVVLHKSSGDVHVMPCAKILSGLLKDGAARLDAFSSSGKFHVLDIDLNNSRAPKDSLSLYTWNSPDISGQPFRIIPRISQKSDTLAGFTPEQPFYYYFFSFVSKESWTHQCRVNIFYGQEAVVNTVNLLMLHATLRNTG